VVGYQQVGVVRFPADNNNHAAIWSGVASSVVDVHPVGAVWSALYSISGPQQVGQAQFGDAVHAGLWSGSSSSFVDLNPAGSSGSEARGTTATLQAGYASFGGHAHAGIWFGTADSFMDLHPTAASDSSVWAASGSQQVGYATFADSSYSRHAGLWSGPLSPSWISTPRARTAPRL
jgi:hypothetical protein